MKKILHLLYIAVICLVLTACGHSHVWVQANCTVAKHCSECGETEGEALGHNWIDADCVTPKTCMSCGETEGESLEHNWDDADCVTPKTCNSCGVSDGEALGHLWLDADCENPAYCDRCDETQGEPLGHDIQTWNTVSKATCSETGVESGVCAVCGVIEEKEIAMLEHTPGDWVVTVEAGMGEEGTRTRSCKICKEELETEQFSLTPEEVEQLYKKNCQRIPYNNLSRTPGEYEGVCVKFTGTVVQVCSEAESALEYSTYRVATNGSYRNVVYVYVDNYGSGSRILEDDRITFYGEFDGLYTYTTVMGASVTIPCVKAAYVD